MEIHLVRGPSIYFNLFLVARQTVVVNLSMVPRNKNTITKSPAQAIVNSNDFVYTFRKPFEIPHVRLLQMYASQIMSQIAFQWLAKHSAVASGLASRQRLKHAHT